MSSILIVNEISAEREELARALEAEGFHVVQAGSPADAIREIWAGTFIVAVVAAVLTGTSAQGLADQIQQMAPEIETLVQGKNDDQGRLVRKVIEIRDGVAAA